VRPFPDALFGFRNTLKPWLPDSNPAVYHPLSSWPVKPTTLNLGMDDEKVQAKRENRLAYDPGTE